MTFAHVTSDAGFLAFSAGLVVIHSNEKAAAFAGRTVDGLIGLAPREFLPEAFQRVLEERLRKVTHSQEAECFEERLLEHRLSVRVFPLGDDVAVLLRNLTSQPC